MFQLTRDEQISLAMALLIISAIIVTFFVIKPHKSAEGVKVEIPQSNTPAASPSKKNAVKYPEKIYVHIAGEVAKPNVYVMWKGSRVFEAIALAGLTRDSDMNSLNLASILNDGEKIVVPKKGEWNIFPAVNQAQFRVKAGDRVNINIASQKELESLPGIGAVYASRIIEYRLISPFSRKEDLMKIKGIGDKTFEKLKDKICVE